MSSSSSAWDIACWVRNTVHTLLAVFETLLRCDWDVLQDCFEHSLADLLVFRDLLLFLKTFWKYLHTVLLDVWIRHHLKSFFSFVLSCAYLYWLVYIKAWKLIFLFFKRTVRTYLEKNILDFKLWSYVPWQCPGFQMSSSNGCPQSVKICVVNVVQRLRGILTLSTVVVSLTLYSSDLGLPGFLSKLVS